jgi:hypothetical protein
MLKRRCMSISIFYVCTYIHIYVYVYIYIYIYLYLYLGAAAGTEAFQGSDNRPQTQTGKCQC